MKNKFFFLGSLCLVLALGLVLFACEEGGENPALAEVAPSFTKAILDEDYPDVDYPVYIVRWTNVEDAVDYGVFVQTQGLNKAWKVDTLTNNTTYSAVAAKGVEIGEDGLPTGEEVAITNWAAVVDFGDFGYTASGDKGFGRIGVMAIPYKTNKNPSIVWSEDFFIYEIQP